MLSDRERQELGLIEAGLRDDSRLAASLVGGRRPPPHLRPRVVRTAVVVGLVIALSGLVLGAAGVFLQGALVAGAGYGWWVGRGRRSAERWNASAAPPADPGGTPGRSS
jgi:Protein of unknown function (DUF3040)